MEFVRRSLAVCLVVLLAAPAARAQQSVIGTADLERSVRARVQQEQADRAAIASLLRRAEVRQIAAKAGLSIEKAEAGVATLQGDDLRELAAQARQAENDLAGGATTIVLTATTIIIILLIIIIIVLIAD
jgi:cell division protein FtsL